MKAIPLVAGGVLLLGSAALAAWQASLPAPLTAYYEKLGGAKSLTIKYSHQLVGGAPTQYTLVLSKPNLFKLTYPGGFDLSDGKTIYAYKKDANSYTETPISDEEIANFEKRPEVYGWAVFLDKKPGNDVTAASQGANKIVKGAEVQVVDMTLKGTATSATLLIDPATSLAKGYSFKKKDKEYLAIASSVEAGDAKPDGDFAFVAPDGAKKVEPSKSSFADVQTLMNDNCMPCHSTQRKSAGFILDTYDGISNSVVAGKPADSILIKALRGTGVTQMPKGRDALSEDQIKKVEQWITDGAKNQ